MSMPKGHKFSNGYATVTDQGLGFREIAERMTADGDEMNHATARNVLLRGLSKIARPVAALHAKSGSSLEEETWRIASDPRFQEAMIEILSGARKNK
jgi:hypothetical protein